MRVDYEIKDFNFTKRYSPDTYYKYDNYDAINVDKTEDIPEDFFEAMGVPISALGKLSESQFEILGITTNWDLNQFYIKGSKRPMGEPSINGRCLYLRILIRRKRAKKSEVEVIE